MHSARTESAFAGGFPIYCHCSSPPFSSARALNGSHLQCMPEPPCLRTRRHKPLIGLPVRAFSLFDRGDWVLENLDRTTSTPKFRTTAGERGSLGPYEFTVTGGDRIGRSTFFRSEELHGPLINAYGSTEMGFVFCGDLGLPAELRFRTVGLHTQLANRVRAFAVPEQIRVAGSRTRTRGSARTALAGSSAGVDAPSTSRAPTTAGNPSDQSTTGAAGTTIASRRSGLPRCR